MKHVSTSFISFCLVVLGLMILPFSMRAQTPVVPGTIASLQNQRQQTTSGTDAVAAVGLQQFYSATGKYTLSADGKGTSAGSTNIRINKPNAQSTVQKAILISSVTSTAPLAANCVTIAGTAVTFAGSSSVSIFTNYWADVTSIVAPHINPAAAGIMTLPVTECSTGIIEGEALLVIFNDPTATEKTIIVMTGAQNPSGDNFSVTLAQPINPAAPGALLDMGLGIGFSYQLGGVNQASQITVNNQRLTSSAGGEDDGEPQNGALLTVGGIGDVNTNPADPLALPTNARSDDELYTILPFINNTTTSLNINTINPSLDDNIFLAYFAISGAAVIGEGILLSPTSGSGNVGTNHTVKASVLNTSGQPVPNRLVTFTVNSGPNAGKTFSTNTNASGEASFTYTGTGGVGTDNITACFTNSQNQQSCSNSVSFQWTSVGPPNIFYSKPTGDLHLEATWGLNMDGTGTNPTDFGPGKTFMLANRAAGYELTGDWTVGGILNIPTGSQLAIKTYSLGIADITGGGLFSGTDASALRVNQPSAGGTTLNFTTGGGNLGNLVIASPANTTLGSALNIFNALSVQTGMFNTSNLLTLKSTATNTARVSPVGGFINGSVTVERYIPARRAWRILSAPILGSQTINAAWQEGATTSSANPNPVPGYGTHITEGTSNGFDHNPFIAMASVKQYVNNNWVALGNTNATPVNGNGAPYMLFVRGDRSIPLGLNTVAPNNTTLRATGPLRVGDQTFPVAATGFTAIPNPFASPINFATITKNNVQNNFYVWDPKMGGENGVGAYVLLSFNGVSYDIIPASVSPESQYIQSGQGFLVQSTGTPGSLVIKESDKSTTPAANVFRTIDPTSGSSDIPVTTNGTGLRINLQSLNSNKTSSILDEVFSAYGLNFSDKVDKLDAEKIENIEENISITREGHQLMVDRTTSLDESDIIQLKIWNLKTQAYLLEFNPSGLNATKAYLVDNYLKTTTPIDLHKLSQVYFTVNADAASSNANRFSVTFKDGASTLIKKAGITMYPNPVTGKSLQLAFTDQPKGVYKIELANGLGQIIYRSQIQHGGGTAIQRLTLANQPASGVYTLSVTNAGVKNTLKVIVNE